MARRGKSTLSAKQRAEISGQLSDLLSEFVEEEKDIIEQIYLETAEDTRDDLRQTSPKGSSGDYAAGWEVKRESIGITKDSVLYVVCNPEHYRLTHLLERGHQTFNKFGGPYRRTPAKKHIKPAEIKGVELLMQRLRSKL